MHKHAAAQTEADHRWMAQALELAHSGVGLASPNPTVGCVLERNGVVVGEGFHQYNLRDHAEVVALKAAGPLAHGSTAYVTLEPCSHQGRTGPCANALIAAGVRRVVIATLDPNPAVNGQGAERLRVAGIEVSVGVGQHEAQRLNDGFARWIQTRTPFVTLKAGVTLDGRIAPPPGTHPPGTPYWITSEASRARVQPLRHASDAVITGVNTVLEDNPMLSDRSGLPRRRPLLRVVLDSSLRLPLDTQLVQTAQDDVLVFCCRADPQKLEALQAKGVQVEQIEPHLGRVPLKQVLARLGQLNITSVMLEAGAQLNGAALSEGCVDKLNLFYAPLFLGPDAVPLLGGYSAIPARIEHVSLERIGNDFHVEGHLRDPWQASDKPVPNPQDAPAK